MSYFLFFFNSKHYNMPRTTLLHKISRIFQHSPKSEVANTITIVKKPSQQTFTTLNTTKLLPVALQRAPSSKLLIDEEDLSSLDFNNSTISYATTTPKPKARKSQNKQAWLSNKFATLKRNSSKKYKNFTSSSISEKSECHFVSQLGPFPSVVEIPDRQQSMKEEGVNRTYTHRPLSIETSNSMQYSSSRLKSSSSFWLPPTTNCSTARTSIDFDQSTKHISCISLGDNVKSILGNAILEADQDMDI